MKAINNTQLFSELNSETAANVNGGNTLFQSNPGLARIIMGDPVLGSLIGSLGPLPGVNYDPSKATVNYPTTYINWAARQGLIGPAPGQTVFVPDYTV